METKVYALQPLVRLTDATGSGSLPTPQASNANMRQGIDTASHARNVQRGQLASVALESTRIWPTPTSRDWKDGSAPRYRDEVLQLDTLGRAIGGSLNPQWVSWLMGFPIDWCDLEDELPAASPTASTS